MKLILTKNRLLVFIVLTQLFVACTSTVITTGLEGIVYRGPISPVAIEGQVNDAPFKGLFHVYTMNNRLVKSFESNESGVFQVLLMPGDYNIVPDKSAPVMSAEFQKQPVTVGAIGITRQDLYFDTGIR